MKAGTKFIATMVKDPSSNSEYVGVISEENGFSCQIMSRESFLSCFSGKDLQRLKNKSFNDFEFCVKVEPFKVQNNVTLNPIFGIV